MTNTTTGFAGMTTVEILAIVDADASRYADATRELAGRVLRDKPRPQAIEGFYALTDEDAPARPKGDVAAYKAWVTAAQKVAEAFAPTASPKAKTSTKRKAATSKRKASPKATGASADAKAALAKAMGVDASAIDAMAAFFAKLG